MKPVETQGSLPAAGQVERAERVWRGGAESEAAGREAAQEARRERSVRAVARPAGAEGGAVRAAGRDAGQQARRDAGRRAANRARTGDGSRRGEDDADEPRPRERAGAQDRDHRLDVRMS